MINLLKIWTAPLIMMCLVLLALALEIAFLMAMAFLMGKTQAVWKALMQ